MTPDPLVIRGWIERLHGPSLGQVVVSHIEGTRFPSAAFADRAAAADHAAAQQSPGVYLRCTTVARDLAPGRRGDAADSASLPGLWADLDIGTVGHAATPNGLPTLPDADAAYAAVQHLPEPTLWVHSGGGMYPWWLLAEPLILDDSNRPAVGQLSEDWHATITANAGLHGWHVGGTGDLARVLRIPGTINRKAGLERPCRVISDDGPTYSGEQLRAALAAVPVALRPAPTAPTTAPKRSGMLRGDGIFDALEATAAWRDLLEPAGWSFVASRRDGAEEWLRPYRGDKPESAYSAVADRDGKRLLTIHSTSTGLTPKRGKFSLTMGDFFAQTWHGGDLKAASVDLIHAARGRTCSSAAGRLPRPVLDAIDAALRRQDDTALSWIPGQARAARSAASSDELRRWSA